MTDDYFGTKVEDPYRWLEDDNAETTKKWVIEQNKVTDAYLSKIPFRDKIRATAGKTLELSKFGAPFKKR
ncbi:hypothetical protein [Niabella ginsengisoli]|uniref:hypothetical protein n=1 Tax=Niabella ginsengisoli TaxID=522298 RepID=UPI00293E6DD1|nr:hypothetical protein [Niabella ginsengisoli]